MADDAGGEEVGAGELFLSGISACAVNMVERLANQDKTPLQWMDVSVEAYRDPDKRPGEITVYDAATFQQRSDVDVPGDMTTNLVVLPLTSSSAAAPARSANRHT